MVYECQEYEEIRNQANQKLDSLFAKNGVDIKGLLPTDYLDHTKLKNPKTALKHQTIQAWKGNLTQDIDSLIKKTLVQKEKIALFLESYFKIVAEGLHRIKIARNTFFILK